MPINSSFFFGGGDLGLFWGGREVPILFFMGAGQLGILNHLATEADPVLTRSTSQPHSRPKKVNPVSC